MRRIMTSIAIGTLILGGLTSLGLATTASAATPAITAIRESQDPRLISDQYNGAVMFVAVRGATGWSASVDKLEGC